MKCINALSGLNAEDFNVKTGGAFSNDPLLKG
jgi:hypothetical protein